MSPERSAASATTASATATLGVGLVGSGFMGRAHAFAFQAAGQVFGLPVRARLEMLADRTQEEAQAAARALGFARATGDWQALVGDPAVDIVAIAAPNALHAPVALAALRAGKHVYCEKPLATMLADAEAMADAAQASGRVTLVGFNYLRNPMLVTAREMIESGEIGEVTGFRGIHAEGFMADPDAPFSWRCETAQAGGALADLGSHIVAVARFLLGEACEVCARLDTIHTERTAPDGSRRRVEVDDQAALLVRFRDRPFTASLQASWLATGREMQLAFELSGTRGSIAFTQERFNELRIFRAGGARGRAGFTTLEAGPAHGDYGAFCPAPGHQIGFNDLKTIEVKHLLDCVGGRAASDMDFGAALAISRVLDAAQRSSKLEGWLKIETR